MAQNFIDFEAIHKKPLFDYFFSEEKTAACAYICEMTYGYENQPVSKANGYITTWMVHQIFMFSNKAG